MNAIASFPAGRIQGGFRRAWLVWTMGLLSLTYLGGLSLPGNSATAVVNLVAWAAHRVDARSGGLADGRRLLSPDNFLELVEEAGLMRALTRRWLRSRWTRQQYGAHRIAG